MLIAPHAAVVHHVAYVALVNCLQQHVRDDQVSNKCAASMRHELLTTDRCLIDAS